MGTNGASNGVLNHRLTTMVIAGLFLLATGYLFTMMPKGFLPSEDTDQIFGFTEASQGISFESMVVHQRALAAIVQQDPNVDSFMSSVGAGFRAEPETPVVSSSVLNPGPNARLNVDEMIQELRPKLAILPGIRVFMQNLPPIRIGDH